MVEDPADGIQKVLGNVGGFRGLLRESIFNLPKPVACLDQDTRDSSPVGQFDIGAHVADNKGSPEINLKGSAGLFDETRLGFSAVAVAGEFGDRPFRVMRTEKDPVNACLPLSYPADQQLVKSAHQIQGIIPPGHSGLVRDYENKKPVAVEHSYSLGHLGKNPEPAYMVHIAHLFIDGSIPVDEHRRFFHLPSLSKAGTGGKQ
jgi:hypothetical protein